MDEEPIDLEDRRRQLKMFWYSPAGRFYENRLRENADNAWQSFIKMPPDKKTSKAAFNAQAIWSAYTGELDWWKLETK